MAVPTLNVEFSPTTGPFDVPVWISLSGSGPHGNRVLSAEWADGKQADLGEFPPGEATIVLDNSDRLFDPEHATGTYYGRLNPRVPFRLRSTVSLNAALLTGAASSWLQTPDVNALDVTGDLDIRMKMAPADWTPAAVACLISKSTSLVPTGGGYSLKLNTAGTLLLEFSDGATYKSRTSTVATGFVDGTTHWVRAVLDVNNGAAGHDVKFYTSDDGATWTQLGATVTTAGVTSVGNATYAPTLGADIFGNNRLTGSVYRMMILNGIDGTVVADANFEQLPAIAAGGTFTDAYGRVWTLSAAATVGVGVSTTYDLFYGFVEDGWEQTLSPPAVATCTVKLVDLVAVLNGYTLPSVLEAEILTDAPIAYWPLDEVAGTTMRDASGNARHGIYTVGATALHANAETDDGGSSPGLMLNGEHAGQVTDLASVLSQRPCVVSALVAPTDDLSGGEVVYYGGTGNPDKQVALVTAVATTTTWGAAGAVYDGTANNEAITNQGLLRTDAFHHLAFRAPAAGATKIYVDGADATNTNATVPSTVTIASGSSVGGGKLSSGRPGAGQHGFQAHVAVFNTDIGAVRIAAHADAALAPLDGLRSDEQVSWILDTIGVPATLYTLDAGVAIMGPLDSAGRNALELIREITATEQGDFYAAHHDGGKLKFRQRYASFEDTRSTVTQVTFSDDDSVIDSAACRVDPGTLVVEPNGIASVINQASVGWSGGTEVVDESAGSPYGPRPVSVSTRATSPAVARGVGQWIVARNSTPATRVRSLGIDPGSNNAEFTSALGTRIGDRAAYRSFPQSTGAATTKALEVLGRRHVVEGVEWRTTFYLTPAPADGVHLFTLGTSQLTGTHILAY